WVRAGGRCILTFAHERVNGAFEFGSDGRTTLSARSPRFPARKYQLCREFGLKLRARDAGGIVDDRCDHDRRGEQPSARHGALVGALRAGSPPPGSLFASPLESRSRPPSRPAAASAPTPSPATPNPATAPPSSPRLRPPASTTSSSSTSTG